MAMTNRRVGPSSSHTQVDPQSVELFIEGDKNQAKSKHKKTTKMIAFLNTALYMNSKSTWLIICFFRHNCFFFCAHFAGYTPSLRSSEICYILLWCTTCTCFFGSHCAHAHANVHIFLWCTMCTTAHASCHFQVYVYCSRWKQDLRLVSKSGGKVAPRYRKWIQFACGARCGQT